MTPSQRRKSDRKPADPVKRAKGAEPAKRAKSAGSSTPSAAAEPATDDTREKAKDAIAERRRPTAEATGKGRRSAAPAVTPSWIAPLAVVLLIIGLIYLVTYYLSSATMPLPIGDWNLLVGFGVLALGGVTLMFWK
ncbi:hypothetical protein DEO23_02940 [Brachybacterium endophyticum]|uniref:Cell division protein CrgA n=1 Tax=Brachybacterium endophyticum TaxID=2182385 RepID=A0A2U2RP04_9MICO|nr:cell division protein CrgA [Brachybacterium endophyticum]PWH07597.1 hypothetical protein DEO23_02940 [Brachybacterium endophyticum]